MSELQELCQLLATELFPNCAYFKTLDDTKRFQILYSAVGLHMLASVYDLDEISDDEKVDDGGGNVSMKHVLARGKRVIQAFSDLYSDKKLFDNDEDEKAVESLEEKIRAIFLRSGCLLHSNYRLAAPPQSCGRFDNVLFLRGHDPWELNNIKISGLGFFKKSLNPSIGDDTLSVQEQFCLYQQPLRDWWRKQSCRLQWKEATPEKRELFNLRKRGGGKYWMSDSSVIQNSVNLYRTVPNNAPWGYGLVRSAKGKIETCDLPRSLFAVCYPASKDTTSTGTKFDTMSVALALMNEQGITYNATIEKGAEFSWVQIDWLLPCREQDFFELFSWPSSIINNRWRRLFSNDLLPFITHMLENLGFVIQEV